MHKCKWFPEVHDFGYKFPSEPTFPEYNIKNINILKCILWIYLHKYFK